jgi:hypothetical protein
MILVGIIVTRGAVREALAPGAGSANFAGRWISQRWPLFRHFYAYG